jgi:hypothetical protein
LGAAQAAKDPSQDEVARLWEETPLTPIHTMREKDPEFQQELFQKLTEATQDKTLQCAGEFAELLSKDKEQQAFVYTLTLLVVSDGKTAEIKQAEAKHWDDALTDDAQSCFLAAVQGASFPAETSYAYKFELPKRLSVNKH